ncbi:amidohydrolase family protein [Candidatus Bathyarchaeota archaeon]|nr:amidohydrolase family protein [Candidatus Bathyarchaeota archaeon]
MSFQDAYLWLLNEFEDLQIVDAHEHLPPEKYRISRYVDVFTLFSHYTLTDLITAGLPENLLTNFGDFNRVLNPSLPLEERWRIFKPYYNASKHTSYFRAARIALKEFYGVEDLTDENYLEASKRVKEANKPGLYRRVLREKCHIKAVLTQIGRIPEEDRDFLIPILPMRLLTDLSNLRDLEARGLKPNVDISSLEDYLSHVRFKMESWKRDGVVGLKFLARQTADVSKEKADKMFKMLLKNEPADPKPLNDFLVNETVKTASELNMVISVHTGILAGNWEDFSTTNPMYMIPMLRRHRNAKFDLYHAGIPWVRELGVIGKTFPNVWLNLCWCHVISQEITCSALSEWVDLMPVTKIIGFGGDYSIPVEKIYGHLVMAKEDVAEVLARRISKGLMKRSEALEIARMWFYENPVELYGLRLN